MFQEFLTKLSKFVAKKPGLVVSIVAIFIILSAISAQNIKLTSGTESMFSKHDVTYRQYKLYQKDFGVSPETIFILIKADNIYKSDVLNYMLKLQKQIDALDGVSGSSSLATIVKDTYGYIPSNEVVLKRIGQRYKMFVPKSTLALIIVQLSTTDKNKQQEIAKEIQSIVKFTPAPIGVHAGVTGGPALDYQITQEIKESFRITMAISTILMIVILYLTFSGAVRKKYTAFMPLIISILAVQAVYGLMPILGIPLSEHTNGALPMLIGLGIEYAAQLQNRYEEERREGKDIDEAIVVSTTRTGLAIVMALVTTVIGFMSMLAPGIPAMAQFGIVATLGLILAYILTLTFLPAVLKIIDRRSKGEIVVDKKREEKIGVVERSLSTVSSITASRPWGILVVTALIILVGGYCAMHVGIETNYKKYVPQNLPAMQRFNQLQEVLGGQATYVLVLSTDGINSYNLKKADELAQYIVSREDLVYKYDSITKLIKSVRKAYGLGYTLPQSDAELFSILNQIPKPELKKYISGNLIAIYFYSNADEQKEYVQLYKSIKQDVRFFGWKNGFYVTGEPVIYGRMGQIMIYGQSTMTIVAYILVIILLLVVYRSLRKALVPLIAITTVIAVMNTIMYIAGIKQTMISIALNSITLGLGIDFSIHVLERYFEERMTRSPIESVKRTIERTGKAITTSALTMAGGFGSLIFSPFPIIQNFGFIALIAIIFSLVAALTVVPAFLMVTEKISFGRFGSEVPA